MCRCTHIYELQGVDKIMETLSNLGIEFVCVGYIEGTSFGNSEYSCIFLHCIMFVSAH
jgi:hypothetical protein